MAYPLKVLYPHHLPFPFERAHDIHVFKTNFYLAREGIEAIFFVALKKGFCPLRVAQFYGFSKIPANLKFVSIPYFRRTKFPRLTVNLIYEFFLLLKIRSHLHSHSVILCSEKRLVPFLKRFFPGIPIVFEIHGLSYFKKKQPDKNEQKALRKASLGLVTTKSLLNFIRKVYKISLPLYHLSLATEPVDSFPYLGPKDPPILFYTGQLYPSQGVELLLKALKNIPKAHLFIAGGKPSEISHYQKLASQFKVKDRVIFLGFVPYGQIKSLLLKADILLLPALAEGKQLYVAHQKLYDYLSVGRPIVASDLPSVREEVKDGEEAVLFEPNNSDSLAEAIDSILQNPDWAKYLAQKAHKKARELTWEIRTQKLIRYLLKLV